MAVSQQKLEVTHARPNRKKPGRAGCAGRGAKILREAAGEAVDKNGKEIADSLLQGALKGNVSSTKLLLSLADLEQEQGDAGKIQHGWSTAQTLAAEPQWQDPAAEASAETTGGSREPED